MIASCRRSSPVTPAATATATPNMAATQAVITQTAVYLQTAGPSAQATATMTAMFVTEWGQMGTNNGQFDYCNGLAVSSNGNVYVADSGGINTRIQEFTGTGTYLAQWNAGEDVAVATDSSGNVYAVYGNNYIEEYTGTGTFITQWGGPASSAGGSGNGQFYDPQGLAVAGNGNVYVADTGNYRIQVCSNTGAYISQWGSQGTGNGQFSNVKGIAIDNSGNVYVTDYSNDNVQKFTSTGTYITQWGGSGAANGQFNNPWGIAIDNKENVYVVDEHNWRIQEFSGTGTYIRQWGSMGYGYGQFQSAAGVAVNDSTGDVYVCDQGIGVISVFHP